MWVAVDCHPAPAVAHPDDADVKEADSEGPGHHADEVGEEVAVDEQAQEMVANTDEAETLKVKKISSRSKRKQSL